MQLHKLLAFLVIFVLLWSTALRFAEWDLPHQFASQATVLTYDLVWEQDTDFSVNESYKPPKNSFIDYDSFFSSAQLVAAVPPVPQQFLPLGLSSLPLGSSQEIFVPPEHLLPHYHV